MHKVVVGIYQQAPDLQDVTKIIRQQDPLRKE